MGWFLLLATRRLQARWRSLLTLIIGVLLAALIGANASLYTTAISQVGMVQFLETQPSADVNVYSRTSLAPANVDDFGVSWTEFDTTFANEFSEIFADLENWTGSVVYWAETQDLFIMANGEDIENASIRLAYYSDLEIYAELIDGAWFSDTPVDADIEVVLAEAYAKQLGLAVGDVVALDQRGWETSEVFTARISGLIREIDGDDPYWFSPSPLRNESSSGIDINLLTSRASMERIPPQFLPQPQVQVGWRIAFDPTQLPFTQLQPAAERITSLDTELRRAFLASEESQGSFVYSSSLPTLLDSYRQEIVFLNIPFGLLLLQLGALVLFFLVLIAALVRRGERREIAMLQSRGAQDSQIIWLRMLEAFIICASTSLVAPFIAEQVLAWYIPTFTGIESIQLELTPTVFLFAAGTALLALVLLTATLLPVLREPLISAGGVGSRSHSQTWWQKYYLDVVLLIVGGAALFQLTRSQSIVAQSATGNAQADPLLLLAPTLLFVAFSSVLLRFFPGMMNIFAGFYARRRGAEFALATWQVSREPLHYGRIAFLLALAIGIGWFAIGYQGTLIGNQSDQAVYLVGSDVRVVYRDAESPETSLSMERIAAMSEVQNVAQVTRIELANVSTGGGRRSRQEGEILAVDMAQLQAVTRWRDDLGSLALPASDISIASAGRELPADTQVLRFAALLEGRVTIVFNDATEESYPDPRPLLFAGDFSMRLRDAAGQQYSVNIPADAAELEAFIAASDLTIFELVDTDNDTRGDTFTPVEYPNDGWLTYELDLSTLEPAPQGNLSITGLTLLLLNSERLTTPRLVMTDFQTVDTGGNVTQLDWASNAQWDVVRAQNALGPTTYTVTENVPQEYGSTGLQFEWDELQTFNAITNFSLLIDFPEAVTVSISERRNQRSSEGSQEIDDANIVGIPALVSQSFVELNQFAEGQRFTLVVNNITPWFEAGRIVNYFPTLYQERPFVVVDAAILNYALDRATGFSTKPNELWIQLADSVDERAFVEALRQGDDAPLFDTVISTVETLDTYETDVLALGVIGLLFLSFVIGLSLSVVSLFTYISLTVQSRMGEFAVLRALGMTNTRMVLSIVAEQFFVLVSAIVLGAVIGQFLTMQVLPPLALSAAGGSVTPPFVLIVDFVVIAQYLLVIIGVLIIVLGLSSIWVRNTANADALRVEE
jgi:hypothetical protein